jgi:hypothetical protein
MKSALIAALVSAVVASGSAVAATKLIDGHSIRNHTIPATKLTEAAVASLHGLRGPRGYRGATGHGTTFSYVHGPVVSIAPLSTGQTSAQCPAGAFAVGGTFGQPDGLLYMQFSSQDVDGSGNPTGAWDTVAYNPSSTDTRRLSTWAVCAS